MVGSVTWLGWISRTAVAAVIWLGGGVTSYQTAKISIPKPPHDPAFWDVMQWAVSGSDPAALFAAVASGLGLIASAYQIFGPKPYSEKQGEADRKHQNASFKAAERQQAARHQELKDGIADLIAEVRRTQPGAAAPFAETLTELAGSAEPADVAIAETAVDQSPEAAADALMAEVASGKRRNAERARQAARLYAPSAPGKAKAAYEEAVSLDTEDVWSWIELGRLKVHYEGLAAARTCFLSALQRVADERDRSVLHDEFGAVLWAEGRLADARREFEAGLSIAERLATSDPTNSGWQRDLSISRNKLGDVAVASGDLGVAQDHYAAGLRIRERLAASDPANSGWQRDLSVGYERLGDLAERAGDRAGAVAAYRRSLPIAERLAADWPDHPGFARDLTITRRRLADLELGSTES